MTTLTATVVIPTRNRGSMIVPCLRSVLALEGVDVNVLVVDQSEDDSTSEAVSEVAAGDARVELIRSRTVGLSASRNLAAAHSSADVLAYTDDDCELDPAWLVAILNEFEDPRVGAVFGRVVPPGFKSRNGLEVAFKPSDDRVVYRSAVPPWHVGHGANMAVRRKALIEVGGFDESLGAGAAFPAAEDLDAAYRLVAARWWLVYSGAARAYHLDWRDWKSRQRVERGYGIGAGAMFMKHLRCGDLYGARLFMTWTWELGVRRVGAGLLKWRSAKPMYLGYCQLLYPWIGAARSLARTIDRESATFSRAA
ncbi:MAG TPA: glycosyltransferase [Candidatus Dormibacteraeota bacterium]|jgi:glycosyltransferase involved in cell wall biosynthesis|nr:glycosyltransferase [Candidatus Dormibacteraeota bacterium]